MGPQECAPSNSGAYASGRLRHTSRKPGVAIPFKISYARQPTSKRSTLTESKHRPLLRLKTPSRVSRNAAAFRGSGFHPSRYLSKRKRVHERVLRAMAEAGFLAAFSSSPLFSYIRIYKRENKGVVFLRFSRFSNRNSEPFKIYH